MSTSPIQRALQSWTTRDLIVTAVIAVALGLLYMAYSGLYLALTPILGQVGIMLALGFYYLVGVLTPYIIRKPGTALLASFLAALTELLVGSPFGIMAVWAGLVQGLGAELAFGIRRWQDYRLPVLMLAAVLSGVFAFIYEYFLFSYSALALPVQIGLLLVRLPSALVLAGWLGKMLGDALARTGALRGLAISQTTRQP